MDGLKGKIQEALRLPLVGDYVFSEDELNELYQETGYLLRRLESEWGDILGTRYDELVFVSIVNACKEWNSEEDTFFGYLFRKFVGSDDFLQKTYNYLRNVIERVSKRYNLLFLGQFKKKYYISLSAQAMSPAKSMDSFFELCWRIYRDDLSFDYVKGDSVFSLLADALRARFSDEIDEDSSMNLGSHVYFFKAWLKGIAAYRNDLMMSLIERTIHDIDRLYNGVLLDTDTHYSSALVSGWWKTKSAEMASPSNRKRGPRSRVVSDYSLIKPKYIIDEDTPGIFIESFRLKTNFDVVPYAVIFSGGKEVCSFELSTKGSGLLMSTKPFLLDLRDCSCGLEDLSLKITHGSSTIYDSKNALKRQFALFKDGHEVTSSVCIPGNYQLYVPDFDVIQQYPDEFRRAGQNMYIFYSEEGDVLQSTARTVFFESEDSRREFWLYTSKQKDMSYRERGKDYDISDGEVYVGVADGVDPSQYCIVSDGASFCLDSFPCEQKDDGVYYQVSALMLNGIPQTISVADTSTRRVAMTFGVVKYTNPTISFDRSLYYADFSNGVAKFHSEMYEGSSEFSIDNEEVLIGVGNGEVVVRPPILTWTIDDEEKHYGCLEQNLWYKKLSNSSLLRTSIPGRLMFSDGTSVHSSGRKGFKIGEAVYAKSDSGKNRLDIIFRAETEEPILAPIATVVFSESFSDQPFEIDELEKTFQWRPEGLFIGSDSPSFRLELNDSLGRFYSECDTGIEAEDLDLSDFDDDYYSLRIYLKSPGFLKKERCIYTKRICIGNHKNLKYKNAVLRFTKIYTAGSKMIPRALKPFYVDNIKFLRNRDGFDFYSGHVFIQTYDGRKIYLDEMKNDYGGIDRINPVRLEMKDDKSCWIVFGLGKDIDDFESEFSFDKNRNMICNSDDPEKVLGIRYYTFEKV